MKSNVSLSADKRGKRKGRERVGGTAQDEMAMGKLAAHVATASKSEVCSPRAAPQGLVQNQAPGLSEVIMMQHVPVNRNVLRHSRKHTHVKSECPRHLCKNGQRSLAPIYSAGAWRMRSTDEHKFEFPSNARLQTNTRRCYTMHCTALAPC